jgi:hypothetical protein
VTSFGPRRPHHFCPYRIEALQDVTAISSSVCV